MDYIIIEHITLYVLELGVLWIFKNIHLSRNETSLWGAKHITFYVLASLLIVFRRVPFGNIQRTTKDVSAYKPSFPISHYWESSAPTLFESTELAIPYSSSTVTLCPCGPGSSRRKGVYNPKAFFLHAASLVQGFPYWPIFSTAASRRSRAHIAVPLLGDELSFPLPVIALVSHYLTN